MSILLRGAGYTVKDLGNDIAPQTIVDAVREEKPQFLGLSALLTGTMSHMEGIIQALKESGLRDKVKVVVGGAPVSEEFAVKPHLSDDIVCVGELGHWSEQKMRLFSRARGYLHPIQWDEPFGIVMAEAMACGTPVVTFERGSTPEVIAHGITGFVVKTMEDFIDAVERIDEISPQACRERAENMFTVSSMVANYERVYMKVLGHD